MTFTGWAPGDRVTATVRGVAGVEVVRTADRDLPWHSDVAVPDYFGPQTEHAERMVRETRTCCNAPTFDEHLENHYLTDTPNGL